MISIVIAIGVFRYFQKLAVKYGKGHWHSGLFGMSVFLGIQLAFGVVFGIVEPFSEFDFENYSLPGFSLVSILGIPVALAAVWFVHRQLEKSWKKEATPTKISEIDGIGKKNI